MQIVTVWDHQQGSAGSGQPCGSVSSDTRSDGLQGESEVERTNGRKADEKRSVKITRHFTKYAEGSVLIEDGETQVLCTASVITGVPSWLKGRGEGWVTAEYGLLPRATGTRTDREAAKGKQTGRTQEIQRLIGRSLRAVIDRKALGENTIKIDCDVLQADGGTRCASITGAYVALADAVNWMISKGLIEKSPLKDSVSAISVGMSEGQPVLDLDYVEDSSSDTDMNVVMTGSGAFVEIQGTAEGDPFTRDDLNRLLDLAEKGNKELAEAQNEALKA